MPALLAASLVWGSLPVHGLELGIDLGSAYYTWKERTGLGKVEESGALLTLAGHVAGSPLPELEPLRLTAHTMIFGGRVDFDTLALNLASSSTTAVQTQSNYLGLLVEGSTGWRLSWTAGYLEPFGGFAYRIWERDIESTSAAQGYPELYQVVYGRAGLIAGYRVQRDLSLTGTLSLDPMVWTREEIDWSAVSGETLVVRNGRRLGWTVEMGVRWRSLEGQAFWQAIRLGTSNAVTCRPNNTPAVCQQPDSDQDLIGFKFRYRF